jgi:uncharacterized protein YkwD
LCFGLGSGRGLLIHNAFRKKHHAPPLIWNTEIAERADKMATEMATKGTLDVALVKSVTKYGENVARISGTHVVCLVYHWRMRDIDDRIPQ